ncbi:MAG: hypothetical protein CL873_00550 [Dehalococcoidales bacterium]|jgi:hypothetical protein|nr:hypothetical protein [Dehalococcoidales bacterium]
MPLEATDSRLVTPPNREVAHIPPASSLVLNGNWADPVSRRGAPSGAVAGDASNRSGLNVHNSNLEMWYPLWRQGKKNIVRVFGVKNTRLFNSEGIY